MDGRKSVKFEASARSTGRGAYNKTRLFSFRRQCELKPHREERSRTGNHGKDTWFLYPGSYPIWTASYSNSGKGGEELAVLIVHQDGSFGRQPIQEIPDWLQKLIPPELEPYD